MDPENTKPGLSSSSARQAQPARPAQPTPLVGAAHPTTKEAASGMPRRSFAVHHKASEHTPHSVPSAALHPVPSAPSATSVPATPPAPARPGKGPAKSKTPRESMYLLLAGPPGPKKAEVKKAIQKRAKGRAKVPHKFRDSVKNFFFSPTGMLKILRMVSRKRETWPGGRGRRWPVASGTPCEPLPGAHPKTALLDLASSSFNISQISSHKEKKTTMMIAEFCNLANKKNWSLQEMSFESPVKLVNHWLMQSGEGKGRKRGHRRVFKVGKQSQILKKQKGTTRTLCKTKRCDSLDAVFSFPGKYVTKTNPRIKKNQSRPCKHRR